MKKLILFLSLLFAMSGAAQTEQVALIQQDTFYRLEHWKIYDYPTFSDTLVVRREPAKWLTKSEMDIFLFEKIEARQFEAAGLQARLDALQNDVTTLKGVYNNLIGGSYESFANMNYAAQMNGRWELKAPSLNGIYYLENGKIFQDGANLVQVGSYAFSDKQTLALTFGNKSGTLKRQADESFKSTSNPVWQLKRT